MTTDIDKLRELAQAATPGQWTTDQGSVNAEIGGVSRQVASMSGQAAMFDTEARPRSVVLRSNAEFIAAANPTAVLDMLDRLARAEQRMGDG